MPEIDESVSVGSQFREDSLCKLLQEMIDDEVLSPGSSESDINDVIERFRFIYLENGSLVYRHWYSSVTTVLIDSTIDNHEDDERDNRAYRLRRLNLGLASMLKQTSDDLSGKIVTVRDHVNQNNKNDPLIEPLDRLVDHIQLEGKRADFISRTSIDSIKRSIYEMNTSVHQYDEKIDSIQSQLTGYQKDSITILGIFAGLVLAFNSGVQFSISGVSAVKPTSPLSVAFIISIVGLFLFNAIFVLLTFIYRIVRKPAKNPLSPTGMFNLMSKRTFFAINMCLLDVIIILGMTVGCQEFNVTILPVGFVGIFYWIIICVLIVVTVLSCMFALGKSLWQPYKEIKLWREYKKPQKK